MADSNDQNNRKPTQSSSNPLAGVSRKRRDLVDRQGEIDKQLANLRGELAAMNEQAPTSMLEEAISVELKKQENLKSEIDKLYEDIRRLHQNKQNLSTSRNKIIEVIRKHQQEVKSSQKILKDPNTTSEQKESAKQQIEELEESAIPSLRTVHAELSTEIAGVNVGIQDQLGKREFAERTMSLSKHDTRGYRTAIRSRSRTAEQVNKLERKADRTQEDVEEYEQRRKEKAMIDADRLTPSSLRKQMMAGEGIDPAREAKRAQGSIARAGAGIVEQQQYRQAAEQFTALYNSIRDTRKALASMKEGTEEFTKTQKQLSVLEEKAKDRAERMSKIEKAVEDRGLPGGTAGERFTRTLGGAVTGAMRFGENAFNVLGDRATSRYVTEESRKQAELRNQSMGFTDYLNRTTDATALLATGAGKYFGGAEMPYDPKGKMTESIDKLGKDFANTSEAMKQYSFMYGRGADVAQLGVNVTAGAFRGGAAGSASGVGALPGALLGAGGEFVQGIGSVTRNTLEQGLTQPEIYGRVTTGKREHGNEVLQSLNETVDDLNDNIKSGGQFAIGGALEWGGGDRQKGEAGIGKIIDAQKDLVKALPVVMQRAGEQNIEQTRLIAAQTSGAQMQNVRERLQMAFAPALQAYMDMQPTMRQGLRSRTMSRAEREQTDLEMENLAIDPELGERGFGSKEIVGRAAQAMQAFGRFGKGGQDLKAARTAMMAEAAGLGGAEQSIGAMGQMLQGGVQDPEETFRKAMEEGLQKGLQDSREFQMLLQYSAQTADSTIGFEGALSGILKGAGTGRAGDVKTAAAAYSGLQEMMSGKTGTWADVVKFNAVNKTTQQVIENAKKRGIELSQADITSIQNLGGLKPGEMENEEFFSATLTPAAREAFKANDEVTGKSTREGLINELTARGTASESINATQDPDLAKAQELWASGDKEGLRRMFSGPSGKALLDKVSAQLLSGAMRTGGADKAIGKQRTFLSAVEAAGVDVKGVGLGKDFTPKSLEGVVAEGEAANTFSEKQARAGALVEQGKVDYARGKMRDQTGRSYTEKLFDKPLENYVEQQKEMEAKTAKSKTVDTDPLKVDRIDTVIEKFVEGLKELKEAFKDFKTNDMVVNATKDIVIQGASAIKGIIMERGVTRVGEEVGRNIAKAIQDEMGSKKGPTGSSPKAPTPQPATAAPRGQ